MRRLQHSANVPWRVLGAALIGYAFWSTPVSAERAAPAPPNDQRSVPPIFTLAADRQSVDVALLGVQLPALPLPEGGRALLAYRHALYVALQGQGIAVFDIRNPGAVRRDHTLPTDLAIAELRISGNELVLQSAGGLSRLYFNVASPLAPRFVYRIDRTDPEDDEQQEPAVPSPGDSAWRTLTLLDGRQVSGRLLETVEGSRWVLLLASRSRCTVAWDAVHPTSPSPRDPPPISVDPMPPVSASNSAGRWPPSQA